MKLSNITVNIRLVLFVAIFIVLNMLAYEAYFRIDFTADKRYTLSQTTKDILNSLEDVVTITAYFSNGLPPQLENMRKDLQDLLSEYYNVSDQKVVYEFVDPDSDPQIQQQVQQMLAPQQIQVREQNKMSAQIAYMGAVVKMGREQEVIPAIQPGAATEYSISKAIKKMSSTNKPKVGLITGHGEVGLQNLIQVQQELNTLYEVDTISLEEEAWSNYKTLIIMGARDSVPQSQLQKLDLFLESGGGLLVALNAIDNPQQQMWNGLETGLEPWLNEKGFNLESALLIDNNSPVIPVQTQMGISLVSMPFFPTVQNYASHPITEGLESIQLRFTRPVAIGTLDSTVSGGVLVSTSETSGKVLLPTMFNLQRQWTRADFSDGPQPLAAYLEGKIEGSSESKIVVIGNADFAINENPQQGIDPNNVNLLVNSVDWLTEDIGLISLRTKGVTNRRIDAELEEGEITAVRYITFLLPIIIVFVFGFLRAQSRRLKRVKWMEQDFG